MTTGKRLSAAEKALQINIDKSRYGTFAEIGAGQEVARWFFRVGGASGTVAKSISAYDMKVSDAIYGPTDRYVSRQRLQAMLNYEFDLIRERLDAQRGADTCFLTFANTVATRGYLRKEDGRGWMGVRFQAVPRQPASEIIIHVRMLDAEHEREQEALGLIGVNLIHAAIYHHEDPVEVISLLTDGIARERMEIDMIKFSGPCFATVDNRLMALQLVQQGMTDATMFTADGETVIPGELLYKKPVLVERGSFRPLTNPMLDLLERSQDEFVREPGMAGEMPVILLEMTLRHLQVGATIDHQDFLDRVDTLSALGKPVLISNFRRYHRLVQYLSRHTDKMIGLPLGMARLRDILDERYYTDLEGGLMESLGSLFRSGVRLYVYPWLEKKAGNTVTLDTLLVAPNLTHLFAHLKTNRLVQDVKGYNPEFLAISAGEALRRIQAGDPSWEQMVPSPIAAVIKSKQLFDWKPR